MQSGQTENIGDNSGPGLKKGRLHYQWVVMAALFTIGIVGFGMRFSFGVFFKSLQDDFGLSRATTSAVFSVYMILSALVVIFGGWALDKYGARRVFILMGFFVGLSLLLTSQVTASWQLFLTYSLLLALGTSSIYVSSMSTISRWFTKSRGLALGIVSGGNSIGMMIISPISAYFISNYGWQNSYLILSLAAFFIMIPCALLLRKPPALAAALPDKGEKHHHVPLELSLSQAARFRSFWLLIVTLFLFASSSYVVLTHLVRHAIDLGIPVIRAASMLTFIGIGSLVGRLVMGRVADTMGSKRGFLICALLMAAAMFWLIGSSNLWMLYLFTLAFGFAFGATAPLNASLIGESFGLRHVGLIMGVIEIGWEAGAALGPALAGYVFDVSGSYFLAFMGGGIAALMAAAAIFSLRTPKAALKNLSGS